MKSPISVCPVPFEQQPVNEYQGLKESWFYGWATRNVSGYIKPIVILWFIGCIITAPIATVSFPWEKLPIHFSLSTLTGASFLPSLALVQLYLGWRYVRSRLFQDVIPYEESGWYDGQTWVKPKEVLTRDRLIVSYEIEPIFQRLRRTFGGVAAFWLASIAIWSCI